MARDSVVPSAPPETHRLRKALRRRDLFSFAFGTIIGVGWITVMGVWLGAAGPGGTAIAFFLGALFISLIGLNYAELAARYPVSGGEVAYAGALYGPRMAFAVSWLLALAYIGTVAFEAISIAWVLEALLPGIGGPPLYSFLDYDIRAGQLATGGLFMVLIAAINFRGAHDSGNFQNLLTVGLVLCAAIMVLAAAAGGRADNLRPFFVEGSGGAMLGGIATVFGTVPFWYAGFDTIPQAMGEYQGRADPRQIRNIILAAILFAGAFYVAVIFASAALAPRDVLLSAELPAAAAMTAAFGSPQWGRIVLFAGLCGILTTWNAIFFAAARVIYAQACAGLLPRVFMRVSAVHGTPGPAILFVACIGCLLVLLGRSGIIPIVNVGAICLGAIFSLMCFGLFVNRKTLPDLREAPPMRRRAVTAFAGGLAGLLMAVLAIVEPIRNGDGWPVEWTILLCWTLLGYLFWRVEAPRLRQ